MSYVLLYDSSSVLHLLRCFCIYRFHARFRFPKTFSLNISDPDTALVWIFSRSLSTVSRGNLSALRWQGLYRLHSVELLKRLIIIMVNLCAVDNGQTYIVSWTVELAGHMTLTIIMTVTAYRNNMQLRSRQENNLLRRYSYPDKNGLTI
jgi:hypothetical protein